MTFRFLSFGAAMGLLACNRSEGYEGPTYYADVEPILVEKCASCHHEGGVGPGDWTKPQESSAAAQAIGAYVEAGLMPLPAADPSCRDYKGSHRMHLTDEERETILAWADAEGPLGDEEDRTPGLQPPELTLSDTDVTLTMPEPHVINAGSDNNDYWCMVLDNPFTETTYVTAFDVDLGDREVVHHMLLVKDLRGDAGVEYGTDGKTRSFACESQVVESDWMSLHAWTPGMEPVVFDEGQGLQIDPGDQLVLQMHYYTTDEDGVHEDQSSYRLRTTDSVQTKVSMSAIGNTRFTIPANDPAYTVTSSDTSGMSKNTILGVFPHMHLLGSQVRAWVTDRETQEETCVVDGPYDFEHQLTYMFKDPVLWGGGDTFSVECTYDNSAESPYQYNDPPQNVYYGEGSNEEMCFLLFYFARG